MAEIERYTGGPGAFPGVLVKHPAGPYVRYDDHRAALQAVEGELREERISHGQTHEYFTQEEDRAEQAEKQLEELREAARAAVRAADEHPTGVGRRVLEVLQPALVWTQPDTASEAPRCGG